MNIPAPINSTIFPADKPFDPLNKTVIGHNGVVLGEDDRIRSVSNSAQVGDLIGISYTQVNGWVIDIELDSGEVVETTNFIDWALV